MTSSTLTHPAADVTDEENGDVVASIHDSLKGAADQGVPLNLVLSSLVDQGYELHAITAAVMQLIRQHTITLTADRDLRWTAETAEGAAR